MTVDEARTASMGAKALVRQGRSPHHEAMANRATAIEERSILPKSVGEALEAYAHALMARRQPLERTRRVIIHYAREAVRIMQAESLPLPAINERMVRLAIETMKGSDGERHIVFNKLNRFLAWCRKTRLNPTQPLRRPRPRGPSQARTASRSCANNRRNHSCVERRRKRTAARSRQIPLADTA
jgi:hypothetical protein